MASYFSSVVYSNRSDSISSQSRPSFLRLLVQEADRLLRDRNAGAFHAARRGIFEPRAPARTDFEDVVAGLQLQLLEGVVELAHRRDVERLVGALIDALRVAGRFGIEEGEEELGIDVVMRADRLLVRVHLAEQQRLDVAPRLRQQVEILHDAAQLERLEHVAVEIDVAGEIGLGDAPFVEAVTARMPFLFLIVRRKVGVPLPKRCSGAIRHHDLERCRDIGILRREAAEQSRFRRRRRRSGSACKFSVSVIVTSPDHVVLAARNYARRRQ